MFILFMPLHHRRLANPLFIHPCRLTNYILFWHLLDSHFRVTSWLQRLTALDLPTTDSRRAVFLGSDLNRGHPVTKIPEDKPRHDALW